MHKLIDLLNLQLLAGEGGTAGGGDGAGAVGEGTGESVVTPADDGQARLLDLGVPKDKIRQNRAYKISTPKVEQATQQKEMHPEQAAAANDTAQTGNPTEAPKRLTWQEIMQDPEYNREMQETMRKRLAQSKAAEQKLEKLAPALELIGRSLNVDMSDIANFDADAFANAVVQDSKFYEDKAIEMGVPTEVAMKLDRLEREKEQRDRMEQRSIEDQKIQQHLIRLYQQGEKLKETFPNFDLDQELKNPAFFRMTRPDVGISVQDAYYAVHRDEIQQAAMQVTAQKVSEKMSSSIQSGMRRPVENGAQPASVSVFDYRNASRDQRAALKKQIMQAAARGEKLYPSK